MPATFSKTGVNNGDIVKAAAACRSGVVRGTPDIHKMHTGVHRCGPIFAYLRFGQVDATKPFDASWMAILTDPVRISILRGLCHLKTATTTELTELCHTSDPTVRRHLEALAALGLVREEHTAPDGITPGRPARRFTIDTEAAIRLSALFEFLSEPLVPKPEPEQPPSGGR